MVVSATYSFFNHLNKAEICCIVFVQALILAYGLSDYLKKNQRNIAAFLLTFSIGCTCLTLVAWHFWPPPDVTVQPTSCPFGASDPKWLGDTCTFSFTNNTNEDKYNISGVLLINSPDWNAHDFSVDTSGTSLRDLGNGMYDPMYLILSHPHNGGRLDMYLIMWNRLKAHESRDFSLRHIKKLGNVIMTACVTSWYDEAERAPKIQSGNSIAVPMTTPPWPNDCVIE